MSLLKPQSSQSWPNKRRSVHTSPAFFFFSFSFFWGWSDLSLPWSTHDTSKQINEGFRRTGSTRATGEWVSNLCCRIALPNPSSLRFLLLLLPWFSHPSLRSFPLFHLEVIDSCSFTLIIRVCPVEGFGLSFLSSWENWIWTTLVISCFIKPLQTELHPGCFFLHSRTKSR